MPEASDLNLAGLCETLFRAYPDGLLVVDERGRILVANPEAVRLLGYPDETSLQALAVEDLVPLRVRSHHAGLRQAFGRQPTARAMGTQTELVAVRHDGSEVMVEIALSPLQHQGHALVVAAMRGIGEYPRVKQALQRERYGQAMAAAASFAAQAQDLAPLAQVVAEQAAAALKASACAVYLAPAGTTSGAFQLAGSVGPIIEPTPVPEPEVAGTADTGQPMRLALDEPLRAAGRTIGLLCLRWLPRDAANPPASIGTEELRFVQSMAGLLATSVQRLQAQEQLLHAQKLESVGQLTGGIAHDFNNLLTVILGNLQVLEEKAQAAGATGDAAMLAAASRAAKRGAELTSRLLAFSRRQVLQPQAVEVPALLQGLASLLRRTLDTQIEIRCEITAAHDDVLCCWADPAQLEAAILNLAINARDAMPDGGELVLGAWVQDAPPAVSSGSNVSSNVMAGPYVAIAVSDTGIGMSDTVLARAFEPFFTTKPSGRGTGLGLATVYGFARQSRGDAMIESTPGKGTRVIVLLPQRSPIRASEVTAAEAAKLPAAGFPVLLVEDDADVQSVVQRLLQSMGAEVTAVSSASAAWIHLEKSPSLPVLVLSDIALGPGERGNSLAQRIHARWPQLPVLLMTGYASGALEEAGRWPVLRKPLDTVALRQAMAALLAPSVTAGRSRR